MLLNKASESISRVSISICGQTIRMSEIQFGGTAQGSYEVTSDSHYTISVEFYSGKKIQKDIGYVTRGMNFWHEITITDSDIQITNAKVT